MLLDLNITSALTGTSATGLAVNITPAFAIENESADDYIHNTFTVNKSTTDAPLSMGLIETGTLVMITCNKPLKVKLTQSASDREVEVEDFLLVRGEFTGIKVTNASATEDAEMTMLVVGQRATNPGTPGVYSIGA